MKTITYSEVRFFKWVEDEVSVTLRNCSGSYGGGQRGPRCLLYPRGEVVGSLQSRDYKGAGDQDIVQNKLIVEKVFEN